MTFGRQKRLLVGLFAFLAPLPLAWNDIVEWPLLILYLLGVALFLRRAAQDPPRWLPAWGMNVLGLLYLPVFIVDLLVLGRGRLVHPVIHLCLFVLLVKLFALTRERDKWQAAMGLFFLFLASMATSVHPVIALYLGLCLVLGLVLLTRFALLHVLAGFGRHDPGLARLPLRGFLAVSTLLVVALAVPLFAFLPRVRSPYIVGRGAGTGTPLEAAGFSDSVTLDSIGQIRNNREVALRLQGEPPPGPGVPEMRFKAATYDLYEGGSWRRTPGRGPLLRGAGWRFRLAPGRVARWVQIWLQPLHSRSLPLPVETLIVEPRAVGLLIDQGGAVSVDYNPIDAVEYRVGLAAAPVLAGLAPRPERADERTLDTSGASIRMSDLADRVMGHGLPAERARRLELHLMQNYGYTQDFAGRSTADPLDDFLFRYKSGHCEYFASAMVLMLRSQGIPARLVTGFLGGEYNPFEGYTIVRNSNAHAWVEAYLEGEGWRIFDPTPPAGRPTEAGDDSWSVARQVYDFVLFRWDRYVLTYGVSDQIQIVDDLRDMLSGFLRLFDRDAPVPRRHPGAAPAALAVPDVPGRSRAATALLGLLFALLAFVAWRLVLRYRQPWTATRAYRRLRMRLSRAGLRLTDAVPPLALSEETAARYPQAAEPAARIVAFYLRESFGGQQLGEEELDEIREALGEAERGMRKAG